MRLLTAAVTSMALMFGATAATAAPIEIKFSHVVAENTLKVRWLTSLLSWLLSVCRVRWK